jgi:hypothetical protein
LQDFTAIDDASLQKLVGELAEELLARSWKLATAESCTGGALSVKRLPGKWPRAPGAAQAPMLPSP